MSIIFIFFFVQVRVVWVNPRWWTHFLNLKWVVDLWWQQRKSEFPRQLRSSPSVMVQRPSELKLKITPAYLFKNKLYFNTSKFQLSHKFSYPLCVFTLQTDLLYRYWGKGSENEADRHWHSRFRRPDKQWELVSVNFINCYSANSLITWQSC